MADNVAITAGSGTTIATDDVGGVHYQVVKPAYGAADSATLVSTTNPLPANLYASGTALTATTTPGGLKIDGSLAHDAVESGNPILNGALAIAHGTNPTAVAAADRTSLYANRAGIPFVIGGHPNVVSYGMSVTTAISNTVIGPTIASGLKFVLTGLTVTADNANTVFPSIVIGFGTANTPAFAGTPGTVKVVAGHPGVPAGGGFTRGDGSGIVGVGADDEELRVTTVGTVTGLYIVVTGYTIES
jgi:hypothetical protein